MELIFAHVEKFKNIENQSFNLSPRYLINYDREYQRLSIDKNPEHIEGFFGEDISNVTAIVGKNGSGKSNLIEFLILHTAGLQVSWGKDAIIISQSEFEKISIITNIPKLEIKTEIAYELSKTDQNNPFFTAECYYYSYLYDGDLRYFQYSPNHEKQTFVDLSTNKRVKTLALLRANDETNENWAKISYAALEARSIAKIIWELGPREIFGIRLPDYLMIVADPDLAKASFLSYLRKDGEIDKQLLEKIERINLHLNSDQPYDRFRCALFFTVLLSRSYNFSPNSSAIPSINFLFENLNTDQKLDDNNLFHPILGSSGHIFPVQLLKYLDKIAIHKHADAFFLPLSERKLTAEFFTHLENLNLRIQEAFHYDFCFENPTSKATFSGGEKALLSLLGRFAGFNDSWHTGKVIFLDEADLGFHPEWQKKWFKYIVEYLPKVLPMSQSMHIVIAAHSPFILSDIPKENVLFLEKTTEGKCAISPGTKHERTFGANIHTLLFDAFFMSEGLLGDFAVQKIEEVIEGIKQRDLSDEKRQRIRKIIDMVGEPIIRSKLEEMYDLYQR